MLYLSHVSQNLPIVYISAARLNWVDLVIGCIIVRGAFVGLKSDVVTEIFKLTVVLLATVFTLHYYVRLGGWFSEHILLLRKTGNLVAFGVISAFILCLFYLMKEGWFIILKVKTNEFVDKWIGFVFALIGNYLICSLILFALLLSNVIFLKGNARNSLFGFYLKDVSISVYEAGYRYCISKVMKKEPFNQSVYKVWKKKISDGKK